MINSRSVGLLLAAVCCLGINRRLEARSYSLESSRCLFDLACPRPQPCVIVFSFMPMANALIEHAELAIARSIHSDQRSPALAEFTTTAELRTDLAEPARFSLNAQPAEDWAILSRLSRWRTTADLGGLNYAFRDPRSVVALDYSDIFESGAGPYKGSQGVSLFFRHKF